MVRNFGTGSFESRIEMNETVLPDANLAVLMK